MVFIDVPAEALERLWLDNDMPRKRTEGALREVKVYESEARDPRLRGVRSLIYKLLTPSGQHLGTVHDIFNADGSLRECHIHDYVARDCAKFVKPEKEPRLA